MTAAITVLREEVEDFAGMGILAFTTTREAGTFGFAGEDAVGEVMGRLSTLQDDLSSLSRRTITGRQVHGSDVITHRGGWEGLLRTPPADGHLAAERGITLTVSVADCVPVFIGHPSGIVALLHSGWRGTVGRIIESGINAFARLKLPPDELVVHLGPSICGRCYEVSEDVRSQLTGQPVNRGGNVDLRAIIAEHAAEMGVMKVSVSADCTRCDNSRYFSHRAGDPGRQIAVIVAGIT
ncbi:MAG: polyphenol oxidase family protein [Gemmatimonadaceae bacterium]